MGIATAKVNLSTLPAAERDAIRAAEAEAEEFYGNIEKEENERVRLAELKKVCGLMWHNRYTAETIVAKELDTTLFTSTEHATMLNIAKNLHPDTEARSAIKALEFITSVSNLYRTMKTGYYFENFPATELLARYGA